MQVCDRQTDRHTERRTDGGMKIIAAFPFAQCPSLYDKITIFY